MLKLFERISYSKKDRQHNGQKKKEKQRSTKHTPEIVQFCIIFAIIFVLVKFRLELKKKKWKLRINESKWQIL